MEKTNFSRRSTAIRQNMGSNISSPDAGSSMFFFLSHLGVNSHSIFGAQGDLANEKLTNLPVLQNTYLITQERYSTPDEQLSSRLIE